MGRGFTGLKRAILSSTGSAAPKLAPLRVRKATAKVLNRLPGRQKEALILALLHDWASEEPAEYHRFIWSNHLSYARYYDFRQFAQSRATYFERLHPLRVELLDMVAAHLRDQGIAPETDVASLLDVGASLGYLPRYAETTMFPAARRLLGIDIDAYAVAEGVAYLGTVKSSVELEVADIDGLESLVGDECFDVITCTGVLQYLEQDAASKAVGTMLRHASKLLALSGPAYPDVDNATLVRSEVRSYDRSLIHNFDRLITENGGRIVARRWAGREVVEGKSGVYLVVGAPA